MKKAILTIATLLTFVAVSAIAAPTNWQPAAKYNITFSTDGVSGIFKTMTGSITFDEANLASSSFDVSIDVASINTGNGLQNKHAKSEEWFDAAKYPAVKFHSKKIAKAGNGYQVTGVMEIHGASKEMTLPFSFITKGNTATFTGTFNVNRNDFHIGKPGGEVGESIKIEVTLPVTKK